MRSVGLQGPFRTHCFPLASPPPRSSPQDDACLAELSLALSVSLDISLGKQQLQSVALGVWSLHAELHEGLFHSELLQRMGSSPRKGAGEDPGVCVRQRATDMAQVRCPFPASPLWSPEAGESVPSASVVPAGGQVGRQFRGGQQGGGEELLCPKDLDRLLFGF